MKSLTVAMAALGASLMATAALAQYAGENGPPRIVWAAHKVPETPYRRPTSRSGISPTS